MLLYENDIIDDKMYGIIEQHIVNDDVESLTV